MKTLVAAVVLLCLPSLEGATPVPQQQLEIKPNPMTPGQQATLKGPPGAVVYLDWDPAGSGPGRVTLDEQGNYTLTCPGGHGDVIATSAGCSGTGASW